MCQWCVGVLSTLLLFNGKNFLFLLSLITLNLGLRGRLLTLLFYKIRPLPPRRNLAKFVSEKNRVLALAGKSVNHGIAKQWNKMTKRRDQMTESMRL